MKLAFDRQIQAVLESIDEGFISLNSHWCFTYVNRVAESILQKKREDLLGKKIWEHLYGWTAQEAIGNVTHELLQTRFPESREALDRFLATGEQWGGNWCIRAKMARG